MALSGIPVSIRNDNVGCATINDDGTIELKLNPSEGGSDLLRGLEGGNYASLSILPVRAPGSRAKDFKSLRNTPVHSRKINSVPDVLK